MLIRKKLAQNKRVEDLSVKKTLEQTPNKLRKPDVELPRAVRLRQREEREQRF